MIYRISEDQLGRVTVSEIDGSTRRVLRSARLSGERGERLMTWLAQCLPSVSRVRRTRISMADMLRDTTTLFDSPRSEAGTVPGTTGLLRKYSPHGHRGTVSV